MVELETYLEWEEIKDGTHVLDFSAGWCPPCRAIEPTLKKLEEAGHKVYKIDIDKNDLLTSKFGVRSIPAVFFIKDGKPVEFINGAATSEKFLAAAEKLK